MLADFTPFVDKLRIVDMRTGKRPFGSGSAKYILLWSGSDLLELRKTSQWCQFENTASKMINVSLWLLTLTPDWAGWERHEFCTFLCSATYSISDIVGGILDCIYISKSLPHLHIILDDDTTFVRNANIKKCIYLQAADRRTIVAWRISWARSEYFFRGEYS